MRRIDRVNILQGTQSQFRHSSGNTLPLVQLPHAMNAWTLQTRGKDDPWFFHPHDRHVEGVRLTHQPSPWLGDHAPMLFTAQAGPWRENRNAWFSSFDPRQTTLSPACLKLKLNQGPIVQELVPLMRGGRHRVSFPAGVSQFILHVPQAKTPPACFGFDAKTGEGSVKTSFRWANDRPSLVQHLHFRLQTSAQVTPFALQRCGETYQRHPAQRQLASADGLGLQLQSSQPFVAEIDLATSYISLAQARTNLTSEIGTDRFEKTRQQQETLWERELGAMVIETDDEKTQNTFHSCLYRTLLFPQTFHEHDPKHGLCHFNPDTGRVHPGEYYASLGFWDTFRTLFPLMAIHRRERMQSMLRGFLNHYRETGFLPKWLAPGEQGIMPGTLIDGVFADALAKKIPFDQKTALEAMLRHANEKSDDPRQGRAGVEDYLSLGYVPCDVPESVNQTLDHGYGDYAIHKLLLAAGRKDEASVYRQRSRAYEHLWDPSTGFMRGKDREGRFEPHFDPLRWGDPYCEGGAYQNSFFIAHDFEHYLGLWPSKKAFLDRLDELFSRPPDFRIGSYPQEIHEMTEMALADFGQCAISNQPSFHLPYLYALAGQPQKTHDWVAKLLREGFSPDEDGFPGDEDNGSLSAWYVLSLIGLYPIVPGENRYLHAGMHCKQMTIQLENGKAFQLQRQEGDPMRYFDIETILQT